MTEEEAILATLEEYAEAYCAKDIDRLMVLFGDGDDISLIGTGSDELCAGRTEIKGLFLRNFSEATATSFQWEWKQVTLAGDFAVVAITLTIHLDTQNGSIKVPVRWTVALARRCGRWRWLHRHASSAANSQEKGTAYPTGESDS